MVDDEQWSNFMHQVQNITKLVSDLTSNDEEKSQKAMVLSDKYLSEGTLNETEAVRIKNNRTVINHQAFEIEDRPTNPNEMNPKVFMKQVEHDANKRFEAKKISKEKADTFKTRAIKAFRRGDYELSLSCYNKAIDHVKDSCVLYTSRSLILIKLKKYNEVIKDCEWALKLNENSFKANLYYAKALMKTENEKYNEVYENLVTKFPQRKDLIDEFLNKEEADDETQNEMTNVIFHK